MRTHNYKNQRTQTTPMFTPPGNKQIYCHNTYQKFWGWNLWSSIQIIRVTSSPESLPYTWKRNIIKIISFPFIQTFKTYSFQQYLIQKIEFLKHTYDDKLCCHSTTINEARLRGTLTPTAVSFKNILSEGLTGKVIFHL